MRLWHYKLLTYLPRQQLLSQWRECCCIAKSIVEKGTPNHILVNRIMDYPLNHFAVYTAMVITAMRHRGYKVDVQRFWKWMHKTDWCDVNCTLEEGLFAYWHNDIYLRQCLYNLEEKAMCKGVSVEEWQEIYNRFKDFTPLWCGE